MEMVKERKNVYKGGLELCMTTEDIIYPYSVRYSPNTSNGSGKELLSKHKTYIGAKIRFRKWSFRFKKKEIVY